MKPRIIITCGDVNGIGIECLVKSLVENIPDAHLVMTVGATVVQDYIDKAKLHATIVGTDLHVGKAVVELIDVGLTCPVEFGKNSAQAGALALASIDRAIEIVGAHHAHAIVTLPLNKKACVDAGWKYAGQTEMIGSNAAGSPLMILCAGTTRVAQVTTHIPLRAVADTITEKLVMQRLEEFSTSLRRDFGIPNPKIAVLGLNPHAGDEGVFGMEEIEIIKPAMDKMAALDSTFTSHGPFPADGFFSFGMYKLHDGVLAMYHDQGLTPIKLLASSGGVNVTAGLSVVRTSPDHGTAFDIAGTNQADHHSTTEAIILAMEIAKRRRVFAN
ncbi:MAG: 4-hydroxythreonine-4-phosphate dehydrogenase PdxA [Ignavibacteria bacterium]|nr:4-hydroxythreonine-4-phosphate dehydrogenase PdxA [Ignavibacteria bacterium]